jgi:hypothetical protein
MPVFTCCINLSYIWHLHSAWLHMGVCICAWPLAVLKCKVQIVAFIQCGGSVTCCIPCLFSDQGGLGGLAADVFSGASLTCKDSVLVGWGGALEDDDISCPVLETMGRKATINVQRCTLQLHPDSTYLKPAIILRATEHASITATDCKLIGPAPGSSSGGETAATAETNATICLVSAAALWSLGNQPTEPCALRHAGRPAALCLFVGELALPKE